MRKSNGHEAVPETPVGSLLPEETLTSMLERLPPSTHGPVRWLMSHWPGRVALRSAAGFRRVQIFDRSMTIAAQLFTSVFPIIIMASAFLGSERTTELVAKLDLPSQQVVEDMAATSSGSTFGLLGVVMVLASATSLARAITRAYELIWYHDYGHIRFFDAWRWVAAVLVLALSFVVSRILVQVTAGIPPETLWGSVLGPVIAGGVAIYLPWLLTAGNLRVRVLAPGAILFALVMTLAQPATARWLPQALETSAEYYGPIGVAFTYIGWLYAIAFALLGTAVVGEVVANDEGPLGQYVRGPAQAPPTTEPAATGPEASGPEG